VRTSSESPDTVATAAMRSQMQLLCKAALYMRHSAACSRAPPARMWARALSTSPKLALYVWRGVRATMLSPAPHELLCCNPPPCGFGLMLDTLGAQSHPSDRTGLTAAQGQQLSDHSRSSDSRMRKEDRSMHGRDTVPTILTRQTAKE